MIEVFKTNVEDGEMAKKIVDAIHRHFNIYRANFDLQDCDSILRIECKNDYVESDRIIYLLKELNCDAEILEDIIPIKLSDTGYSKTFSRVY
jgi:hypothetical protein